MSDSELRTEIALLDQELPELDAQIALVRTKRDRASELLLQALAYPVLSLPNEITSEIFIQYIDVDERRSPLRLTWVCREWRELAHSCCRLWTSFDSKFYAVNCMPFWLRRSGGLPLDLQIDLPASPSEAQAIVEDLCNYSAQWRTVSLRSTSLISFPASLHGPFPFLEKLQLPSGYETSTPSVFLNAPRLREVSASPAYSWLERLPWVQLKVLDLSSESAATCIAILHCAPHLEELQLSFDPETLNLLPPPTKMLVLPRLSTLSLQPALCFGILEYLTVPALQSFTTDVDDSGGRRQLLSFAQLVARSKCVVRELTLNMCFTANEECAFNEWIQNGAF
ncbi:hypothetical protein FB45DRAFT_340649 [Roridomyces roridus]|uniref:F-box domain-containing protein n=1 Tax=Roridomyces roridus TaxID=1738132 RepID=A0AAD7B4S1_9AGAR|nr:hypothetical protein FB45DRAFT_340649 [Roridomyces roridus]